ncbi:hypothetical protein C8R43DRAFT_1016036 [Mycena crocata]|nr:hypothetical protein C8R43DRAFT_1016036 [Mycena crocata]
MPITEIVTLDLIPPNVPQSSLLSKLFHTLAQRQSAYSAYPILFYSDTKTSGRIHVLSGWHDVNASHAWLQSPEWLEIAGLLDPWRTLKSRVYMDINFDTIPRGGILCVQLRQRYGSRGTRVGGTDSRGDKSGTISSAFWEATGNDLDSQSNTRYTMEVFTKEAWEAVEWSMERSADVSMRPLTLPRLNG